MTLRRASHCQRADRGPKGKPPRAVGLEPAAGGDVYTVGDHTHLIAYRLPTARVCLRRMTLAISVVVLVGLALAGGAAAHPKPPPSMNAYFPEGWRQRATWLTGSDWADPSYAGSQYIELLHTEGAGPPAYTGSK